RTELTCLLTKAVAADTSINILKPLCNTHKNYRREVLTHQINNFNRIISHLQHLKNSGAEDMGHIVPKRPITNKNKIQDMFFKLIKSF
ncbi:MAG: hypothetical protein OXB84_07750, partial [Halobacteriovoraceae bacterium]|nr:hypothetical protein [Halobacteriovoraceae bacterium]